MIRGKYTVDLFEKSVRFHGLSFNYVIDFKHIIKGFFLPIPNEGQIALVLQLGKPIHQGQTVYPFIVFQIKKDI